MEVGVGNVVGECGGGMGVLPGGTALELSFESCIQLSMMAHKCLPHKIQRNLSSSPRYLSAFSQYPS